jgi:Eukaryotic aspartyl protease
VVGVNQFGCRIGTVDCPAAYDPSVSSTSINSTIQVDMQVGINYYVNGYYTNDTVCLPTVTGNQFCVENFEFVSILYTSFNNSGFLGLAPPSNDTTNYLNFVNKLYLNG